LRLLSEGELFDAVQAFFWAYAGNLENIQEGSSKNFKIKYNPDAEPFLDITTNECT